MCVRVCVCECVSVCVHAHARARVCVFPNAEPLHFNYKKMMMTTLILMMTMTMVILMITIVILMMTYRRVVGVHKIVLFTSCACSVCRDRPKVTEFTLLSQENRHTCADMCISFYEMSSVLLLFFFLSSVCLLSYLSLI